MKSYYYLRLCALKTYLPLAEYIGKDGGIVTGVLDPDKLLTFQDRDEAGMYLDKIRGQFPNRIVNISYHLGQDRYDATNIKI